MKVIKVADKFFPMILRRFFLSKETKLSQETNLSTLFEEINMTLS